LDQQRRVATAFVIAVLLTQAGVARAQCVTEFSTPPGLDPSRITSGPDGNVWFTEFGPADVARILVSSPHTITEFPVSTADIRLDGIAPGPDGNLWFVEILGNKVGRIEPLSPNTITEFPIPTANRKPQDIVAGPDGNLWFTQAGSIGRIAAGAPNGITEFPIPSGLGASGITVGPDGNLWFAETFVNGNEGGDKIGRITPGAPNTVTEFTIPTAGGSPEDITLGPDGNLWFTEVTGGKIGRITPDAPNTITEFPIPTGNSRPFGITAGQDGNIWFTEINGRKIGRITPESPNTITEYTVPASDITAGPDGNLWYIDLTPVVGRLSFDGCQDCVGDKLKAIAKNEKARFDCLSKAVKTGDASGLSECVATADSRFDLAFASGGECGSPQPACAGNIEACVTNVSMLLADDANQCEAAKLKAVGKLAAAELGCSIKSAARDRPVDPHCLTRARNRFASAFARADASGPCAGEPDLTRLFVEFFCLSQVSASDSTGRVMGVICR
jgi:virginiamycin B lyase